MGEAEFISDEQKKGRIYALSAFISSIVTLLGFVMSIICFKNQNRGQLIFCICYFLYFLLVTLYTLKSKRSKFFLISIRAFLIFSLLFYIKSGGSGGFGLVWITIVPFFSVYLFDAFDYYTFNGSLFVIMLVGLWTPLYKYAYDVGPAFRVRIPIIFLMEVCFGTFLRYRIEKTENDLEAQKSILSEEIKSAASIQKAFLAKEIRNYKKWSVSAKNVPMIGVTGDLYCVFDNDHTLNGVGLFDISGHGISSGLLTMVAKNTIEQQFYDNIGSNGKEELWETVDKINKQIIEEKGEVQNYLTGILIKVDDDSLELVNAGHLEPVVYRKKDGSFEFFKKDVESVGAIGISNFPTFYISQHLEMESGDEIFLFTDGLADCVNDSGEEYGNYQLLKSFKNYIDFSVTEQTEKIIEDVNTFRGRKINDDLTLMILKKN